MPSRRRWPSALTEPSHLLEQAILGEEIVFNALEVADETGATIDQARRLWRALGFPDRGSERAFTQSDAEAVSTLLRLVDGGVIDFDMAVNLTRAVGQTMARLADWEVATLVHRVQELEAGDDATGSRATTALQMVDALNQPFEELLVYVWKRHLAAAVSRVEALGANEEDLHTTQVTVGFADIVAFTALTNELDHDRIGDLVEIFESRCADVVAGQHGNGRSEEHRRRRPLRERGPDPRLRQHGRGDHRRGRARPADARRPRGLSTGVGRDAARRRVRGSGEHGGPADRSRPAQPGDRRPRHRGSASRGPVRGSPAARARLVRGFGLVEPVAVRRH